MSFVVCAYKESPYLQECLRSLLSQTVSCSVSLSTSTPNSFLAETAEKYSVPVFCNEHEPSIDADWNSAYGRAETDYVVLAHQDDLYEPEYAETAIHALDSADRPLIFFSDYYEIRNGKKCYTTRNLRIKRRLLKPLISHAAASSPKIRRRVISLSNPICCPAVAYAKKNLPAVPFRSGWKSNLDWDAWERISKLEGSFLYDPRMLVGHRVHESSTTSSLISENRRTGEDLVMLKRFWPAPAAAAINRIYRKAEDSNRLQPDRTQTDRPIPSKPDSEAEQR